MEIAEIVGYLCVRDSRNPDFIDFVELFDEEENPEPRVDCQCDNCYYNRDILALEILRLLALTES